jgi:hypothetical protein
MRCATRREITTGGPAETGERAVTRGTGARPVRGVQDVEIAAGRSANAFAADRDA